MTELIKIEKDFTYKTSNGTIFNTVKVLALTDQWAIVEDIHSKEQYSVLIEQVTKLWVLADKPLDRFITVYEGICSADGCICIYNEAGNLLWLNEKEFSDTTEHFIRLGRSWTLDTESWTLTFNEDTNILHTQPNTFGDLRGPGPDWQNPLAPKGPGYDPTKIFGPTCEG